MADEPSNSPSSDREAKRLLKGKLNKLDAELQKAVENHERIEGRMRRAFKAWEKAKKKCARLVKAFRKLRVELGYPKQGSPW